jgi:stage III sporulation protein AE
MAMLQDFSGIAKRTVGLIGVISIGVLLIQPSNALIHLGVQTVEELSEYGKLLLPVMTAAMAAEGGVTTSAALYTGTVAFNTVLTTGISKLIIPMIFVYMVLCVATSAIEEDILKRIREFMKWLMTWSLKIVIYLFTGYIGITGVVSGTADAAAVKAAKLAMSGFVPVVGDIIADASETVLVSAKVMKNTTGLYGLIAILAVWIGPFLEIGIQYLMLKITASVCSVFGSKGSSELIESFSGVMGFLLAITGTVCLLFLISIVCLMRGIQ